LAHLFEAMATMDYQPAVPLLRRYVPKSMFGVISRSAAVWALGHLLKSTPDENLGDQLLVRYFDTASIPPEFEMVRRMSAITIGRMKTKRQHPKLREAVGAETDHGLAEYSASWAIEQITGEKIPLAPLPTEGLLITGWFLEPAADSRPEVEPVRP
jgi:HEAT repeat protein